MPIDLLAAFVGIFAALQGLSMLLAGLDAAAKQIEGRATWVAKDGTVFEEFAVQEIESSHVMLRDFEESRGVPLLAGPMTAPPATEAFFSETFLLRSSPAPQARNLPC